MKPNKDKANVAPFSSMSSHIPSILPTCSTSSTSPAKSWLLLFPGESYSAEL